MTIEAMDIDALNQQVIENIRSLIEEQGTNPSRLAKDAGLGHTTIRDMLSKEGASPRYDTMLKIAKVTGVDIRRITIGPDYDALEKRLRAFDAVFLQLDAKEQDLLLSFAAARLSDQDQ